MKSYRFENILTMTLLIAIFSLSNNNVVGQKKQKKKYKSEVIDTLNLASSAGNYNFQLTFMKGDAYNHPTFAIWLEDMEGKLIETLFVTQYFATGIFGHADASNGTWDKNAGEAIHPAALPFWSHKRNIISRDSIYAPTPENPVSDAISGATPPGSFILNSSTHEKLPEQFRLLMEINQTWDWNDYWTNNKYPSDKYYKTSAQPSLVYEVIIGVKDADEEYKLQAIGHGHYSGKDGRLYEDLSTLSTALNIADQLKVALLNQN